MNLPNKLSLLRILLVPIVLLFLLPVHIFSFEPAEWNNMISSYGRIIAGFVFVIASLTDFADGKIARKYNMITNLGKFLDSLADKMLVISVLVAFVDLGRISSIFVIIIILREFMVTGIRLIASEKGVVMAAEMIGKIKTVTQMTAIIYLLFEQLLEMIFIRLLPDIAATQISGIITGVGDVVFLISVIMTIISGLDYLTKNLHYFKESAK
jgi:CDP-diacylglycerol--glycerol-3-phosphate 3-phosphatidyltransferase